MNRRKIDSGLERRFLSALITNNRFLNLAVPYLDTSLFETKFAVQVAEWCKTYFEEYQEAPGRQIESIFHAWVANDGPPEDESEAVHDFLSAMSAEYESKESINVPYLLDEFSGYMTDRKIKRLKDDLAGNLVAGMRKESLEAIHGFKEVSTSEETGYDYTNRRNHMKETFSNPPESLIDFPGAARKFLGPAFVRESLIGIQAGEKVGKSHLLMEICYRALKSRRKVAFFQVGDMSKQQFDRRLISRLAGRPLNKPENGIFRIPKSIEIIKGDSGREALVEWANMPVAEAMNYRIAKKAMKRFREVHQFGDDTYSMFSNHPTGTMTVDGIDKCLNRWKHEIGFTPDIALIDYADILAPESGKKEFRDQVNDTWSALRRLSQVWRMCVVTATQASAASYGKRTQSNKYFSNDKRKNAHVTAMLGLNRTEADTEQGVARLNWIHTRDFSSNPSRCLWVAQCLEIGAAMVKCTL